MERISVDVPEQPPIGSVVVDSCGTAWQRRRPLFSTSDGWFPAQCSGQLNQLHWAHLLTAHGPLDLVHRPDAS